MPTSVCFNQYGPEVEVRELSDLPEQDVGAPNPTILEEDSWTVLGYYTWQDRRDHWAIVGFGTYAMSMGMPNDEALHGHPLEKRGLNSYRNHEIIKSPWIDALERANRVHSGHNAARYAKLRHIVMTFHDSLFEVVTSGYTFEIIDPVKIDRHERMLAWLKAGRHPQA
jgi:hypothetical protein